MLTPEVTAALVSELEDLNTALTFLHDGLRRTEATKPEQNLPDIAERIEMIKKSISRYQPKADKITAALKSERDRIKKEREEKRESLPD